MVHLALQKNTTRPIRHVSNNRNQLQPRNLPQMRHHRQPNPRKTQDPPNRHRLHRRNSRRLQPEKPTANTKHPKIRLPQNLKNRERIHPNSTIKHNRRREKGSRPILRPKNLQSTTHRQQRTLPRKNKQIPRSPTHTTKNLNKKAPAAKHSFSQIHLSSTDSAGLVAHVIFVMIVIINCLRSSSKPRNRSDPKIFSKHSPCKSHTTRKQEELAMKFEWVRAFNDYRFNVKIN